MIQNKRCLIIILFKHLKNQLNAQNDKMFYTVCNSSYLHFKTLQIYSSFFYLVNYLFSFNLGF